jgi:hypothetical protein
MSASSEFACAAVIGEPLRASSPLGRADILLSRAFNAGLFLVVSILGAR